MNHRKAGENKNGHQNHGQNRGQKFHCKGLAATAPVNRAVSANNGSDLLLFASNNKAISAARPQLLRDGQVVYLRSQRRRQ
ncbi:MAG: hypothetical protein IKG01_10170 [Lachnospiraceae bacterium]|nr:hypothetical protein [Lachnospiraceae bacterium]